MSAWKRFFKMLVWRGEGIQGVVRDANAEDASAQFNLGIPYERGQVGFPQDYSESAKWYRKAAEQGHAGAQLYLGIYLANGTGVQQDLIEAFKWIELSKRGNEPDRAAAASAQIQLMNAMSLDQMK